MAYAFQPGLGYLMPTNFGPAPAQNVAHYGDVTTYTILYSTEKDALATLLPEPFEPHDDPLVTVYCQVCRDVDFMAGRGYNIVGVNLAAVFNGKKDYIAGNYAVVLWENDTFPIITGRELLGAPKLFADIPDPQQEGSKWSFHCSLYGTRLVAGEIINAVPLDDATRGQIEQTARGSVWMGWKYIPKADWNGPDVSFPTVIPATPTITAAWFGQGSHKFFDATWESAPTSFLVMQGLRTLVLKEYRAGVITKGTTDLLVSDCRRLE
jgi:acetoacetate decarboxylase